MTRIRPVLAAFVLTGGSLAVAWLGPIPVGPADSEGPHSAERILLRYPNEEMEELARGETKEEGHAWEFFDWWYSQRAYPNEFIPAAGFGAAAQYAKQSLPVEPKNLRAASWTSIGPDNIGGRVLSIAVDSSNSSRLWAGTASGGLWLSTTAGEGTDAWEIVPTGFPTVAVSAIVIQTGNPQNMWIGTGEIGRYGRGQVGTPGARTTYGLGVLRSTDGGTTWQTTGLNWTFSQNRAVQALKIDPTNANVLWAATTEGVYKTTDGGTNWTLSNAVLMAMDVAVDANATNTVYATHGQLGVPDDTQAGIWRTTNGGTNWVRLAGGLPTTNFGRTPLSLFKTAAGPSVVYAGVSNASTRQIVGLYKSTNGGVNWSSVSSTNWASSQAWYDNVVAAHPTNSSIVMAAGLDVYRSNLGGASLSQVAFWYLGYDFLVPPGGPEGPSDYVHADSHAIVFDPANPAIVYVGCDGGVFKSTDTGSTWGGKNGGLQTTQIYNGFATGYTTQDLALGGLQDNGTIKYVGGLSWSKVFGGDGGWCAIDPSDEDVLYEEYVYAEMYKSTDGGNDWSQVHSGNSSLSNFIAPFVISESNPQVLYCGTLAVHKTTNGGASWFYTGGGTNWNGTPVSTIGVSFTSPDTALAATGSNAITPPPTIEVRRTVNGNLWTVVSAGLPNRYLTDIGYDPSDSRRVWIVYSGYGTPHVFASTDAGATFADKSSNLPDIPCQAVAVDPVDGAHVYVGTDLGVYRTTDGGTSWQDFSAGMPPAMILDLVFKKDDRLLRTATFGNGVYERDVTPDATASPEIAAASFGLLQLSQPAPNPFRASTTLLLHLARESKVRADVFDTGGRRVRTLADRSFPSGSTRLEWDGRDDAGKRVTAGVYFVKAHAGAEERTSKTTLLR